MSAIAGIPAVALSIKQPWAWLIVNGHKDIENRDWLTKFRGPIAIHAGKTIDVDCEYSLTCHDGPRHPVTGRPYAIDTGQRLVASNSHWDTYSAPSWAQQKGGIVGVAEIVDCVETSTSEWFVGRYGFIFRKARPVEFVPVRGKLGFFDWRKQMEQAP